MTLTTVKAGAYLHHLELHSPEPERLARFYGDVMDTGVEVAPRDRGNDLLHGAGAAIVISEGPAKKLGLPVRRRDREGLADIRARAETEALAPKARGRPLRPGCVQRQRPRRQLIVFGLHRE